MSLSGALLQAVQEHMTAAFPREGCGLVVDIDGDLQFIGCRNVASSPSEHFVLPHDDLANAEDRGQLVALVHSHPNASAMPSDADRVQCEVSGLTWHIVSVGQVDGRPECGDIQTIAPCGYVAPLLGRQFAHGVLDCYTLVRDFYDRELGINLGNYDREDDWWHKGQELYTIERAHAEGFSLVTDAPRRGDVVWMQVRAPVTNHAGILLGDEGLAEAPHLAPVANGMLHHLYDRLSERTVYGGYWRECTRLILRHREMRKRHG